MAPQHDGSELVHADLLNEIVPNDPKGLRSHRTRFVRSDQLTCYKRKNQLSDRMAP